MLHTTVLLSLKSADPNLPIKSTVFVEKIEQGQWIVYDESYTEKKIDTDDILQINPVDEDDHQEFTTNMLFARKQLEVHLLAMHCDKVLTSIMDFCPETRDVLVDDLMDKLKNL